MASLISEIKVEIPAFLREKSTDLETELFFWIKNAFSEYFIPFNYWYEINLKTEIDNVQAEVRAVVSVDRNSEIGTDKKLIIHNFLLR